RAWALVLTTFRLPRHQDVQSGLAGRLDVGSEPSSFNSECNSRTTVVSPGGSILQKEWCNSRARGTATVPAPRRMTVIWITTVGQGMPRQESFFSGRLLLSGSSAEFILKLFCR